MNENWHFSQGPRWIPTLFFFSQQKMWVWWKSVQWNR